MTQREGRGSSDARRLRSNGMIPGVLYGQGRTGLVMQALAMRLYHLGLDAHVAGAMTTPPVGAGDLPNLNQHD